MRVIICGAGRVGFGIARRLSRENNQPPEFHAGRSQSQGVKIFRGTNAAGISKKLNLCRSTPCADAASTVPSTTLVLQASRVASQTISRGDIALNRRAVTTRADEQNIGNALKPLIHRAFLERAR